MTPCVVELHYWDEYANPVFVYETHFYDNGEVFDKYDLDWHYTNEYEKNASEKVFLTRIIERWPNAVDSSLHLVVVIPRQDKPHDRIKVI